MVSELDSSLGNVQFYISENYRKGPVQFLVSANGCFENILAISGLLRDSQYQNELSTGQCYEMRKISLSKL